MPKLFLLLASLFFLPSEYSIKIPNLCIISRKEADSILMAAFQQAVGEIINESDPLTGYSLVFKENFVFKKLVQKKAYGKPASRPPDLKKTEISPGISFDFSSEYILLTKGDVIDDLFYASPHPVENLLLLEGITLSSFSQKTIESFRKISQNPKYKDLHELLGNNAEKLINLELKFHNFIKIKSAMKKMMNYTKESSLLYAEYLLKRDELLTLGSKILYAIINSEVKASSEYYLQFILAMGKLLHNETSDTVSTVFEVISDEVEPLLGSTDSAKQNMHNFKQNYSDLKKMHKKLLDMRLVLEYQLDRNGFNSAHHMNRDGDYVLGFAVSELVHKYSQLRSSNETTSEVTEFAIVEAWDNFRNYVLHLIREVTKELIPFLFRQIKKDYEFDSSVRLLKIVNGKKSRNIKTILLIFIFGVLLVLSVSFRIIFECIEKRKQKEKEKSTNNQNMVDQIW